MLTAGQLRQAVVEWRNWALPVKLAAVVLVPVVFAVALSVTEIHAQVAESDTFEELGQVTDAAITLHPLIENTEQERSRAADWLVGGGNPDALPAQEQVTDRAVAAMADAFRSPAAFGPLAANRYADVRAQLSQLAGIRQQVQSSKMDAPTAIRSYSGITQSLLTLDRALAGVGVDPRISSTAEALHDLAAVEDESRQQQVWMMPGLSNGTFTAEALGMLRDSQARMRADVDNFDAVVNQGDQRRLDAALNSPDARSLDQAMNTVLARNPGFSRTTPMTLAVWNTSSDATATAIGAQWRDLAAQLRQQVTQLADDSSNAAGADSVVLLSALLVAAAVAIAITRQLLRSLRLLRRSALDMATHALPTAVEDVRAGDVNDVGIDPIPVHSTEEIGQLARAFDQVNQQALLLAAEQATLRRGFSESFVNVSRRSQSLLERQLLLFEELEQDEEDPDQLARLFQLDHLATRMRRNNENLMVLSGSDLARRFVQPAPLADVLRAAVSEIEQYPRVIVQAAPTVKLAGHVASDLVRLVAELLDNAANFSSPDTSVIVSSHQIEQHSVNIDVLDRGIGMGEAELADANARLANAESIEWAMSRRMGLLVAGRLAARHGITVRLHGGRDVEGVRATVSVPHEHLAAEPPVLPRAAAASGRNGFQHHDLPTSASLPQRAATFGEHVPVSPVEEPRDRARGLFEPTVAVSVPEAGSTYEFEPSWPKEEPENSLVASDSSTEWFQPTMEDARHQAQAQRDYQERGWPVEGPALSDPATWQRADADHAWDAAPQVTPAWPAADRPAEQPREQSLPQRTSSGLPRRTPAGSGRSLAGTEQASSQEPSREGAWSFAAMDSARQLAEAAANPEPTAYTAAGLPRRTPRAQLAPGSAPLAMDSDNAVDEGQQRDPDRLRGRLSDFQSGVRRGRHGVPGDEE
jgi:signal transduction histidine kinase